VPNEVFSLGGDVKMEFVWIPGGTFAMGSAEGEPGRAGNEGPQHLVTMDGFWMGKYEVTQAQWLAISGTQPSRFTGDDLPAEQVTGIESVVTLIKFCKGLGYASDYFRLPSEAEWEYACRAGSTTRWHFGDDPALLGDFAWSGENGASQTHPVGEKLPNDFGLYDMEGNVLEWCYDRWHESYEGAPGDGSAWVTGDEQYRVLRGGAYSHDPSGCRSACRFNADIDTADSRCGLRIVWNP
jgi:formylglycine-generating enzyme required for sulfatase activity